MERLDDLVAGSDILINLLPLTVETEGMLFVQMPKGSYLINVGRGRHLIEDDLLVALRSQSSRGLPSMSFERSRFRPTIPSGASQIF
jgi:phosphoglycerate dehydrogenase-like enzyme